MVDENMVFGCISFGKEKFLQFISTFKFCISYNCHIIIYLNTFQDNIYSFTFDQFTQLIQGLSKMCEPNVWNERLKNYEGLRSRH